MKNFKTKLLMLLIAVVMMLTAFMGMPTMPASFGKYAAIEAASYWEDNVTQGFNFSIPALKLRANVNTNVPVPKLVAGTNYWMANGAADGSDIPAGTTVTAVVKDSSLRNMPLDATGTYFTPTKIGTHRLYYSVKNSSGKEIARSENYDIDIVGDSFILDFSENQRFLLWEEDETPEMVPVVDNSGRQAEVYPFLPAQSSNEDSSDFWLPIPVVKNQNAEQVFVQDEEPALATIEIINGTDTLWTYDPNSFDLEAPGLLNADGTINLGTAFNAKIAITPSYNFTLSDGTLVQTFLIKTKQTNAYFKFKYTYAQNSVEYSKVYDVHSIDSTKLEQTKYEEGELVANMVEVGSPKTAALGKETTMFAPNAYYDSDKTINVAYYTRMEIVHVKGGSEYSIDLDNNGNLLPEAERLNKRTNISDDFKFTPPADLYGNYRVYFKVFDAYGNMSIEGIHAIYDVYDDYGPSVMFAEDYEVVTTDSTIENAFGKSLADPDFVVQDGSYILPKNVKEGAVGAPAVTGSKGTPITWRGYITLPAIYATDDVTNLKDMKFKRELTWKPTDVTKRLTTIPGSDAIISNTIDAKLLWEQQNPGLNYPGDNKAISIWVEETGEYSVAYSATESYYNQTDARYRDKTSTKNSSPNITVVEVDKYIEPSLPSIRDSITPSAKPGEVFKFANPTASAKPGDKYADANYKVETFYYYATDFNLDIKSLIDSEGVANYLSLTSKIDEMRGDRSQTLAANKVYDPTHLIRETDGKEDLKNYYINVPGTPPANNLFIVLVSTNYNNRAKGAAGVATVRHYKLPLDSNLDTQQIVADRAKTEKVNPPAADKNIAKLGYYDGAVNGGIITNAHQNYNIYLPKVTFKDDDTSLNMTISVYYVNQNGEFVNKSTAKNIKYEVYKPGDVIKPESTLGAGDEETNETSDTIYKVSGEYMPTKAGQYLVVYTAKDKGNNINVITFNMWVKSTIEPTVQMPEGLLSNYELEYFYTGTDENGNKIRQENSLWLKPFNLEITDNEMPVLLTENALTLAPDSDTSGEPNINPDLINAVNLDSGEFRPTETGTFKFVLSWTSPISGLTGSVKIVIEITDNSTPQILNQNAIETGEHGIKKITPDYLVPTDDTKTDYEHIIIPNISAWSVSGEVRYSISIKKNGVDVPFANLGESDLKAANNEIAGNGDFIWFKPIGYMKDGTYIVTYEARNGKNNKPTTLEYPIILGDIKNPEIKFSAEDEDVKIVNANQPNGDIYLKNGEHKLTLNLNTKYVWAEDDNGKFALANAVKDTVNDALTPDDEDYYKLKQVSVRLVRNGNETIYDSAIEGDLALIDNNILSLTLTKTGSYTLTYYVYDLAGWEGKESFSFEILEKEGSTTFTTVFLGVAITVVALCGLGIALFFALKDPKKPKGPGKEPKQKKPEVDEGKIVV